MIFRACLFVLLDLCLEPAIILQVSLVQIPTQTSNVYSHKYGILLIARRNNTISFIRVYSDTRNASLNLLFITNLFDYLRQLVRLFACVIFVVPIFQYADEPLICTVIPKPGNSKKIQFIILQLLM